MKAAIACVANSAGRLNGKETVTLDRKIKGVAGLLQWALRHTESITAEQAVTVDRLPQLRILIVWANHDGAKVFPLGAISRGLCIGQV